MTTTLPLHLHPVSRSARGDQFTHLAPPALETVNRKSVWIGNEEEAQAFLKQVARFNSAQLAPEALILDWEMILCAEFRLLKQIRRMDPLKATVLIAHGGPATFDSQVQTAFSLGLDDVFSSQDDLKNVHHRIDFIRQYKHQMPIQLESRDHETVFRTPVAKRIFDVAVSSILLLALSPFLLLIAFLIKWESKGPVFYLSKRVGMGCTVFDFIKFRSMTVDADQRVEELSHLNQYTPGQQQDMTFFKVNNDPRVTRIGRLLRKTSLDELPQLINVLKGDMSLVGNRPLPLYEAERLTRDQWAKRFLAPAGITGLWQVTRRGKSDMSVDERIDLDMQYANRYSLWFDLKIIAKTLPAMIQEENV